MDYKKLNLRDFEIEVKNIFDLKPANKNFSLKLNEDFYKLINDCSEFHGISKARFIEICVLHALKKIDVHERNDYVRDIDIKEDVMNMKLNNKYISPPKNSRMSLAINDDLNNHVQDFIKKYGIKFTNLVEIALIKFMKVKV